MLLILPSFAWANQCTDLFSRDKFDFASIEQNFGPKNTRLIRLIVQASEGSATKYLKESLAPLKKQDPDFIENMKQSLEALDPDMGISPKQWESFLYKLDPPSLKKQILPKFDAKKSIETRLKILSSVKFLNKESIASGIYRENSLKDHMHHAIFVHKAIRRTLGTSLSALSIFFFGYPVYVPIFNLSDLVRFPDNVVEAYEKNGFAYTYEVHIRRQMSWLTPFNHISRNLPSEVAITFFAYYAYGAAVIVMPQAAVKMPLQPEYLSGRFYESWQKEMQQKNRPYDVSASKEAQASWEARLYELFHGVFRPLFRSVHGYEADLTKPADKKEWEQFLADYDAWVESIQRSSKR